MRGRFVISFLFIVALASGCGFNPHPIDGTLSCNDGCPAGYVCRTAENRCWRASTPIADGGSDGAVVPKDGTAPDIGARDGLTAEAGRDVSADSSNPSDAAGKKDGGAEDGGEGADTVGSSDDAPVSADGTAGNGDTGGAGGGAGGGSDGSAITDGSGDAERGAAGAGGSGMTSGGTSGGGGSVTTSGGVTGGNNSGGSVTASGGITGGSHASGGVGGTGGGVGGSGGAGSGGSGGASSSGVCVPTIDKQCVDSTHLKTCGADGQWPATGTPCPYVCIDNPGNTDACGGVCVPTADKQCADSTHLKTCGADGQWPATGDLCPFACIDNPGNTDVCGGLCVPGLHQCSGNILQVCSATGVWTTETTCGSGTPLCRNNQCAASVPYDLGNDALLPTSANPISYTAPASVLYAIPITVQYRTQVTSFGMVARLAGNNVVMALYADATPASTTPTSPAGRVVSSIATAVTAGPFLVPVTGVVNIQPGNYWLAALHDAAVATYYDNAAGASAKAAYAILGPPNPYPAIPTSFPTSTPVSGYKYDLYVVLQDY